MPNTPHWSWGLSSVSHSFGSMRSSFASRESLIFPPSISFSPKHKVTTASNSGHHLFDTGKKQIRQLRDRKINFISDHQGIPAHLPNFFEGNSKFIANPFHLGLLPGLAGN